MELTIREMVIKRLDELGMSRGDFAKRIGTSKDVLNQWLSANSSRRVPAIKADIIAKTLYLSADGLIVALFRKTTVNYDELCREYLSEAINEACGKVPESHDLEMLRRCERTLLFPLSLATCKSLLADKARSV